MFAKRKKNESKGYKAWHYFKVLNTDKEILFSIRTYILIKNIFKYGEIQKLQKITVTGISEKKILLITTNEVNKGVVR